MSKIRWLKMAAFAVFVTFVTTNLDPVVLAQPVMTAPAPIFSSSLMSVPSELGQITGKKIRNPESPVLIHIQSAHGNAQAEKNIEKLLRYLDQNNSASLMLLEGAFGKLRPELFRIFPKHPEFNRKVMDRLIGEGYLTGPEAFLIESSKSRFQGWGVENLAFYQKDRDAFIAVIQSEKIAERYLRQLKGDVEKRFTSQLGKNFLGLVRKEQAFQEGRLTMDAWIQTLAQAAHKYLKQDLTDAFYQDEYPSLVRYLTLFTIKESVDREKALQEAELFFNALKERRVSNRNIQNFRKLLALKESDLLAAAARTQEGYSTLRLAFDLTFQDLQGGFSMAAWPNWHQYAQQIILMQEMETSGLQGELTQLKKKILDTMTRTPDEKIYLEKSRRLFLLQRLMKLELTRSEYEELKSLKTDTNEGLSEKETLVFSGLKNLAMQFYATAREREEKMFQNALQRMKSLKQNRAVLVTGGFHSDGLNQLAEKHGISYLEIMPKMQEITKRDQEIYRRSILVSRSVKTAHMSAALALDFPGMTRVLGPQTRDWMTGVRSLIVSLIQTEDPELRPLLGREFLGNKLFSRPNIVRQVVPLAPMRSELRSDEQGTIKLEKDLQTIQSKQFLAKVLKWLSIAVWFGFIWFGYYFFDQKTSGLGFLGAFVGFLGGGLLVGNLLVTPINHWVDSWTQSELFGRIMKYEDPRLISVLKKMRFNAKAVLTEIKYGEDGERYLNRYSNPVHDRLTQRIQELEALAKRAEFRTSHSEHSADKDLARIRKDQALLRIAKSLHWIVGLIVPVVLGCLEWKRGSAVASIVFLGGSLWVIFFVGGMIRGVFGSFRISLQTHGDFFERISSYDDPRFLSHLELLLSQTPSTLTEFGSEDRDDDRYLQSSEVDNPVYVRLRQRIDFLKTLKGKRAEFREMPSHATKADDDLALILRQKRIGNFNFWGLLTLTGVLACGAGYVGFWGMGVLGAFMGTFLGGLAGMVLMNLSSGRIRMGDDWEEGALFERVMQHDDIRFLSLLEKLLLKTPQEIVVGQEEGLVSSREYPFLYSGTVNKMGPNFKYERIKKRIEELKTLSRSEGRSVFKKIVLVGFLTFAGMCAVGFLVLPLLAALYQMWKGTITEYSYDHPFLAILGFLDVFVWAAFLLDFGHPHKSKLEGPRAYGDGNLRQLDAPSDSSDPKASRRDELRMRRVDQDGNRQPPELTEAQRSVDEAWERWQQQRQIVSAIRDTKTRWRDVIWVKEGLRRRSESVSDAARLLSVPKSETKWLRIFLDQLSNRDIQRIQWVDLSVVELLDQVKFLTEADLTFSVFIKPQTKSYPQLIRVDLLWSERVLAVDDLRILPFLQELFARTTETIQVVKEELQDGGPGDRGHTYIANVARDIPNPNYGRIRSRIVELQAKMPQNFPGASLEPRAEIRTKIPSKPQEDRSEFRTEQSFLSQVFAIASVVVWLKSRKEAEAWWQMPWYGWGLIAASILLLWWDYVEEQRAIELESQNRQAYSKNYAAEIILVRKNTVMHMYYSESEEGLSYTTIEGLADWEIPEEILLKVREFTKENSSFKVHYWPKVESSYYDSVDPAGSAVAGLNDYATTVTKQELRWDIEKISANPPRAEFRNDSVLEMEIYLDRSEFLGMDRTSFYLQPLRLASFGFKGLSKNEGVQLLFQQGQVPSKFDSDHFGENARVLLRGEELMGFIFDGKKDKQDESILVLNGAGLTFFTDEILSVLTSGILRKIQFVRPTIGFHAYLDKEIGTTESYPKELTRSARVFINRENHKLKVLRRDLNRQRSFSYWLRQLKQGNVRAAQVAGLSNDEKLAREGEMRQYPLFTHALRALPAPVKDEVFKISEKAKMASMFFRDRGSAPRKVCEILTRNGVVVPLMLGTGASVHNDFLELPASNGLLNLILETLDDQVIRSQSMMERKGFKILFFVVLTAGILGIYWSLAFHFFVWGGAILAFSVILYFLGWRAFKPISWHVWRLRSDNYGASNAAALALVRFGQEGIDPLVSSFGRGTYADHFAPRALAKIGKPAIPRLIAIAKNPERDSDSAQRSAVTALGLIGGIEALDTLLGLFQSKTGKYDLLKAIQKAMVEIGESAVEPLVQMMKSTPERSIYVAEALGEIGDARPVEIQVLLSGLDSDYYTREKAAIALHKLGWRPSNEDEEIRYLFAARKWEDLVKLGKPAVPFLLDRISEEEAKGFVIYVLNGIKDTRGVEVILPLIANQGSNDSVEFQTRWILSGQGPFLGKFSEDAIRALLSIDDPRIGFLKPHLESYRWSIPLTKAQIQIILEALKRNESINAQFVPPVTHTIEADTYDEYGNVNGSAPASVLDAPGYMDFGEMPRSEVRMNAALVVNPALDWKDTSDLAAKIQTAREVAANFVSPILSRAKKYLSQIARRLFPGRFEVTPSFPQSFAANWPHLGAIFRPSRSGNSEGVLVDQRSGIPDTASILPLMDFALYHPQAEVVISLIANPDLVKKLISELLGLSVRQNLPRNFKIQSFQSEADFVEAFTSIYNSAAPKGRSVALVIDQSESMVTERIGSRRKLLSVIGDKNPLKQTASSLLAADKLRDESIWTRWHHFISVETLGGLDVLMSELSNYISARKKLLSAA